MKAKKKKKLAAKKSKVPSVKLKSARQNKKRKQKTTAKAATRGTSDSKRPIAPHFGTAERTPEPNTDVEMPASALTDSYQTDSRPRKT